jgi:hypothetical protein
MKKAIVRPEIRGDWTYPMGEGCKLELGATVDGLGYRLVSIVADPADGEVWVEVYPDGRTIQIPLADVRRLLDAIPDLRAWHDKVSTMDEE